MTDSVATNLVNALDRNSAMLAYVHHGAWMFAFCFAVVLGFVSGRSR